MSKRTTTGLLVAGLERLGEGEPDALGILLRLPYKYMV